MISFDLLALETPKPWEKSEQIWLDLSSSEQFWAVLLRSGGAQISTAFLPWEHISKKSKII